MQQFHDPFFKVLSKSDSGDGRNNIAGILIPLASRFYFPPLSRSGKGGRAPGIDFNAELVLDDGSHLPVLTRYSLQNGSRANAETRLTGGLEPLRRGSHERDIMLIERSIGSPILLRISLLRAGTSKHARAQTAAGSRKSGVLTGWTRGVWSHASGDKSKSDPGLYRFRALKERRAMIARLDRIDPIGEGRELSWEFDAIDDAGDEAAVQRAFVDPEIIRPFALLRIAAPFSRMTREIGFDLTEGSWVEIVVEPSRRRGAQRVDVAQLAPNGYTDQLSGTLGSIRLLAGADEPPRPLPEIGASAPSSTKRAVQVRSLSRLPKGANATASKVRALLQPIQHASSVQVRDVGQASFVTILGDDNRQLAHFDAGWPISFNGHTAPSAYPVVDPAPVILSHWDWDHLHAWFAVPTLRSSSWVAPRQPIGPGAAKMARALHDRGLLLIYAGRGVTVGLSSLLKCNGTSSLNDTGLALSLSLQDLKRVLMVGDSDYVSLPHVPLHDGLVVTHHGAKFSGAVPMPSGPSKYAVISVGFKNVYGHPSPIATHSHKSARWELVRTSRAGGLARGDRRVP